MKRRRARAIVRAVRGLVLLTALAALGLLPPCFALRPGRELSQYSRHVWNTSDDLPQNAVTALLQDSDGYLWIGTQGGLARFDGVRFTAFDHTNTPAFRDSFVTALAQDGEGRIWVGSRQGLLRYDGWEFERFGTEDGLPHEYVRSLLVDSRGRLWAGTYGGGLVRAGEAGFEVPEGELSEAVVRVMFEDRRRGLWIGASRGLYRLGAEGLEVFGEGSGLPPDFVRAIAEDPSGRVWVGTEGGRLLYLEEGRFREYAGLEGAVSVRSLHADEHGTLWVGTEAIGLVRLLEGGGQSRLDQAVGLPHDSVLSLLEDREGSLWVGTRAGLVRLESAVVTTFSTHDGLESESVRALYEDAQGRLWVGTEGGGLQVLEEGRFVRPDLPEELAHAWVRTILEDGGGRLWLGTRSGVSEYRPGSRVRHHLDGETIHALTEFPAGTVWAGTAGDGLVRWEGGRISRMGSGQGLSHDNVRALAVSAARNCLWVGTEAGLNCVGRDGVEVHSAAGGQGSPFVLALLEDSAGDLWVGTAGGLTLFTGGRFVDFASHDDALNTAVFQILEDGSGYLWLGSPKGIVRVSKEGLRRLARGEQGKLQLRRFTEADGMLTSECAGGTQPAGARTRDGRIWFPTLRGVVMIDPAHLPAASPPPPPLIERVVAGGVPLRPRDMVETPVGNGALSVQFTAPSFLAPTRLRFRYRLVGHDPGWVESEDRRAAFYTNLSPGSYRLEVQASRDGRNWSDPAAAVGLRLLPALYQTNWFRMLVLLAAVALVAVAYRLRVRSLESRRTELEEVVEERTEQLRQANLALQQLASVDDLTGLANHRRFQAELSNEWRRAARTRQPLTLVLVDIDHFKLYNDTYGHLAGDACLEAVAAELSRWVRREGDLLARFGGEEFVALLPGTTLEDGLRLAEQMRRSIEALEIEHRDSSVREVVTVSAGVASRVPDARESPEPLFEAADQALYRAKHSGRNRVASGVPGGGSGV